MRTCGILLCLTSIVTAAAAEPPAFKLGPKGSVLWGERPVLQYVDVSGPEGTTCPLEDDVLVLKSKFPDTGAGPGAQVKVRPFVKDPTTVFVPHLAPEPHTVMGDHSFRSPAIILADSGIVIAVVPDLDDVAAVYRAGCRSWLDYDHESRTITMTAGYYRVVSHVFYQSGRVGYQGQDIRLRLHVLVSDKPADIADPYGFAARFLWQRWGHPLLEAKGAQSAPFEAYNRHIIKWAFDVYGWLAILWQEFELDGKKCGGPTFIVDVLQHPTIPRSERRWREPRGIWNQAWFSTQRCADGLYRYARQVGSDDLKRRAQLCTNTALAAPQTDGLFPAVYEVRPVNWKPYTRQVELGWWDDAAWANSDRRPPDASGNACHIVDAAFTCRQLLEWYQLTHEKAALEYVQRFADRLCRLQQPSGAFPGWVEPDGKIVPTLAEGPESAVGATLLMELAPLVADGHRYREPAHKALDYLAEHPVAKGRWEDFETYFSCCRWGYPDQIGKPVARNGVYKSSTLSMFWCAEAFLDAYRTFKNDKYLALGRRCIDELSLYQQVWNPPFIHAPCLGGFGVMNADGEWNDARQSLFAPLYFEYGLETGDPEYTERGIAALRASYYMLYCPENQQVRGEYEERHKGFGPESYGFEMENIAHAGPAPPGGASIGSFTIFTWGNGSALATSAKVRDLYGDVLVEPKRGQAFGIDGCHAVVNGDEVEITDPFNRKELTVVWRDQKVTNHRKVELKDGKATVPLQPAPAGNEAVTTTNEAPVTKEAP